MSAATISDLPLELIEKIAHQLDPKDVPQLMKVNKRLYSSYVMDQSIVFGKHVAKIETWLPRTFDSSKLRIQKFIDSPPYQVNATHPFFKRIDSCDKLDFFFYRNFRPDGMLLKQLKSVNQLKLYAYTKEDFGKLFTNFCGSIKKNAILGLRIGSFEQDQGMKEQFAKFIENQLNECERITLTCNFKDCFHVYLEAMMKTQIKVISIQPSPYGFDQIVGWIVNQGIPSENPEAVLYLVTKKPTNGAQVLLHMQRFQQATGKSLWALLSRANELLRENNEKGFRLGYGNISCFHRRIDPTTSCVYVFYAHFGYMKFFAFYMRSQ